MKENKVKRAIYLRIFAGFLAVYLVLMAGFSIYSIFQWNKVERLDFYHRAALHNSTVERTLQNYLDSENRIIDISKFRRDLAPNSHVFTFGGRELAVYTGDYDLVYHTNDYWICNFEEFTEGNTTYFGSAYLNLKDWFSVEEIAELENYMSADPKPRQAGDLVSYSIRLDGLWLDEEMIIPDKIVVTPIYAERVDEDGWVASSRWGGDEQVVYIANSEVTEALPYFKRGTIPSNRYPLDKEKQTQLRSLVLDREKMKEHIEQGQIGHILIKKTDLLTYRYYVVLPYRHMIRALEEGSYYSDFWTVVAGEVDLWEKNAGTLVSVWLSCLFIFLIAALILSFQTYRTYQKREELERHRRELTYALAHDLKTPLSIISGYAQNLMENVRTEKREHYAGRIREKVEQMDGIIREMLDLFRLEAEARPIVYREVSLGELCRGIIDRYGDVCSERSLKILLEGDQIIKADPTLIKRVLDNFFVNALAHTPNNGMIKISISNDILEFFNSGSHIPEEKIEEIWQPYRKAEGSRSSTNGTGLGLAIAGRILEAHQYPYGAKNSEGGVSFWFKFA
ncbi:MAG: HAMP domain-containing histidine kinase [Clostridia bacterium]|nr:HAMP domain-containing histidine kinase [Clostridia bacterium]